MIIFGSRGMNSTAGMGQFHCPRCGPNRTYSHIVVRRWFTLYFIPVIPLFKAGEYIECTGCAGTFGPEALQYNPEADRLEALQHLKRMLILSAAAEGTPTAARLQAVKHQVQTIVGEQLSDQQILSESQMAAAAGGNLSRYARDYLNEYTVDFKVPLLAACGMVLTADNSGAQRSRQTLLDLGLAMGFTPPQVDKILAQPPSLL